MTVKGYKVFNPDWSCHGFRYEVGETYEIEGAPIICERGFHFCKQARYCFSYYGFDPKNKVAEVLAIGEVVEQGNKCCTNKIKIVREIPWQEVLDIVNTGKGNTGFSNSGNSNSGSCNSGNYNSGSYNSGEHNSGDCNSGSGNSGNYNSGYGNSGNYNSGSCNSGSCNSGNWNQGNYCTGDFNISNHETGCFCTQKHKIRFFDKESDITYEQWHNSEAYRILTRINLTRWIYTNEMTDEEKIAHPEYETIGGYLKVCDFKEACLAWWNSLTDRERKIIQNIPNFDAEKFELITGIKVDNVNYA